MIDFTEVSSNLVTARGQYATVRAALEDELKLLQALCGLVAARSATVLRGVQDGTDPAPLLSEMRAKIDEMEALAARIVALQSQKAELKPIAWG